jgi:2-oxoglutarate dehydrogenase E1 component
MNNYLSYMNETNIAYVEALYEDYQNDPDSVEESWRHFFEGYEFTKKHKILGLSKDQKDNAKVEALINKYRLVGHLYANINPLTPPQYKLLEKEPLNLEGIEGTSIFNPSDLTDKPVTFDEIVAKLERTYCGSIGVDIGSLPDSEQALWFQKKIEASENKASLSLEEKKRVYKKLAEAEGFEKFLQNRYLGQKRFSLEGLESLIPLLDSLFSEASELGAKEACLGMAHRGRLNVLRNIMGKSEAEIFREFEGTEFNPYDIDGDVKYHKGYANTITCFNGKKLRVYLAPNPSHLEAVNPVLEGFTKCRQENYGGQKSVFPVLIHGDAAFIGQGIVSETLNLSRLSGYSTGGTIHIITNNLIGFTTNPEDSRSCHYSSDVAKVIRAPVLHVNSQDPEAVIWAARLACSFRDKFHHDIVIDLIGYRKYGHNETDEPTFTQPLMYAQLKTQPTILKVYGDTLLSQGVFSEEDLTLEEEKVKEILQKSYEEIKNGTDKKNLLESNYPEEFRHILKYERITRDQAISVIKTSVSKKKLEELTTSLTEVPEDFTAHPKIVKLLESRKSMLEGKGSVDWAFAELLAFASLADSGFSIRLSGQDSKRGTFSSRHAVLFDYKTGETYEPLKKFNNNDSSVIINSPLSELACLGFEFGYSVASEKSLVLWEAQFGDFVNGAQIILDQFLVASEAKWKQVTDLVLLLPHGYEGMGPEHSSARLERFLQAAGNLNIQVCSVTTPAQYFHLLRRQKLKGYRKPLVIMSPKSLLRHPKMISETKELISGAFSPLLISKTFSKKTKEKFAIMCSGKIYYDLLEHQESGETKKDPSIIRFEQIYPFPKESLEIFLKENDGIKEIRWVQEEPQNMGAWNFIYYKFSNTFGSDIKLRYVGRKHSGSTAEGSLKAHQLEQKRIVTEAFS